MGRVRYKRRRHRRHYSKGHTVLAYVMRAAVVLVSVGIVVLMGCGGMYLYDSVFGKKVEAAGSQAMQNQGVEIERLQLSSNKEVVPEDDELTVTEGEGVTASNAGLNADEGADADGIASSNGKTTDKNSTAKGSAVKDSGKKDTEEDEWTVVLDAGHGGKDVGTNSGKIYEKDINLNVTRLIQEMLEEQGVNVVMTRDKDTFLKLQERVDLANEEDADLFVSIHCNSYEDDASIKGMDCYYPEGSELGEEYAKYIMEVVETCKDIKSRGYREETYYVTEHSEAPAVLIELGFMTNASECKKLNSESYQQLLAEELSAGILHGLEEILEEDTAKATVTK